jgi:hypothetical protein
VSKTVTALIALLAIGFSGAAIAATASMTDSKATVTPVASEMVVAQSTENKGANGGGTGYGGGHGQDKGQGATKNNANGRF